MGCWTPRYVSASISRASAVVWRTRGAACSVAVRTGAPTYHEVFGRPFWEDLQAHPDLRASFDAFMGPAGTAFLTRRCWSPTTGNRRTLVNVGGATGSLLAEILRARPKVRGMLVDLPPTVVRSVETFQVDGVAERVTAVSQSFFDPLPAGADLYLLKNVRLMGRNRFGSINS